MYNIHIAMPRRHNSVVTNIYIDIEKKLYNR